MRGGQIISRRQTAGGETGRDGKGEREEKRYIYLKKEIQRTGHRKIERHAHKQTEKGTHALRNIQIEIERVKYAVYRRIESG